LRVLTNYYFTAEKEIEILSFSGKFNDTEYYTNPFLFDFNEIIKNIPSGWVPDVVVFVLPEWYAIPRGIENSPWPTVALLADWFSFPHLLPEYLAKFDFIYTDKFTVKLLNHLGVHNVEFMPFVGYDSNLFTRLPDLPLTYDVTFTGNFNMNVQAERFGWLQRLCKIDPKYHVKLYYSLWGQPYVKLLNQSRIVFNHSISGAMNMRAFEATACGALLFMEEENMEVRDFLEPDKDVVLYNNHNFEEKLYFYLQNEPLRAKIAENGTVKIQNYSRQNLMRKLLYNFFDKKIKAGDGRKRRNNFFQSNLHRDMVQESMSVNFRAETILSDIKELISEKILNPFVINDSAVIIATLSILSKNDQDKIKLYSQAETLLQMALRIKPSDLLLQFNLAQILFEQNKYDAAAPLFTEISYGPKYFEEGNYPSLIFPYLHNYPFRFILAQKFVNSVPDTQKTIQEHSQLIRSFAMYRLAQIAESSENKPLAIMYYEKALEKIGNWEFLLRPLILLYEKENRKDKIKETIENALKASPFDFELWTIFISLLNEKDEVNNFLEQCVCILQRLQDSEQNSKMLPFLPQNRSELISTLKSHIVKTEV
jgi:tetratricopeptide (TPR) repeat protein